MLNRHCARGTCQPLAICICFFSKFSLASSPGFANELRITVLVFCTYCTWLVTAKTYLAIIAIVLLQNCNNSCSVRPWHYYNKQKHEPNWCYSHCLLSFLFRKKQEGYFFLFLLDISFFISVKKINKIKL